jgi:hypothetical protein
MTTFRTADGRTISYSETHFHSRTADGRTCCLGKDVTTACAADREAVRKHAARRSALAPPPPDFVARIRTAAAGPKHGPVGRGGVPAPPDFAERLRATR